jgi:DNA-directed RNA polymerase specialized sigma subunit
MEPTSIKKPTLDSMHADWMRTSNVQHMHQMLDTLAPDIDKAIYAYSGLNAGPAVKTRAKLLAAKAIKSYQPQSGSSLKSWVYTQLQPLTRYSRELSPAPVPERAYQQLSSLKKIEADFYENKGRVPSDNELSDLTSMSMRQINKIRGMDKKVFSESATPFSGENSASSQEITATQNAGFQKDVLDTMYNSFTPQEQIILEHKLGYNGKKILSNNDIAKKLKVSPGRVSQMTTNVAKQLDEYANLNKGMM